MRKIITAAIAAAVLSFLAAPAATAAAPSGCRTAWKAPHSAAAEACREAGWTITGRLVVTPRELLVRSALPRCHGDRRTAGRCMGHERRNHHRTTYWAGRSGVRHYVWTRRPDACQRSLWQWPSAAQRRVYGIGPEAQIIEGAQYVFVRFPNGDRWVL